MAVLSVSIGGYLYYSVLKISLFESTHKEVEERVKILRNEIDSCLTGSLLSVKFLAGLKQMQQALLTGDVTSLAETNAVLDHSREVKMI